jgi:hypothetical protein
MKKYLLSLFLILTLLCSVLWASFGQFGTGTGARDSVWMNVATFDTLGYQINADSVWFWRFFRTTLVDSTILTSSTRTGYYVTGKRAFDGTNYGEYNVKIAWKVQGKYFTKPESYTVFDTVTTPRSSYVLTQSFPTNFSSLAITAGGAVTVGTNNDKTGYTVSTNSDKTGYTLTQTFPTNFSSMKISAGGYVSPNFSDIYGTLDSAECSQYFLTTWHLRTPWSTLTASDNIGINWADITNPTTSQNLSATTISTGQVIARADSVTGVGRISVNLDKTSYQLASGQVIARADSVTGVGRLSTNLDKSNYQLAPGQVVARADSVTGTGRLSLNLDKTNYRLSPQGRADVWIEDTTGENSGWAQFFKGRLDANISTRSTFNVSSESVTVDKSNLGAVQANLIPEDSNFLAGIKAKTDKLLFDAQDSLVIDYGRIPVGGGSATNPDTIANHVWIWGTRTLTSGSGTGVNQVIINTFQLPDSIPVIGTQVQVLNQNQSATLGLLNSNPTGQATFALDNGIYKLRIYKSGWVFTVPESIIVSGNLSATFYANAFNPGNPPSANLCRVYGWIRDLKGQPVASVTVEAKISTTPLRYQTVLISPYYRTTSTDSDGYWYLDLYPNSILTPSNTQYDFSIYIPYGTILKLKTAVPLQSSWELQ